MRGFLAGGLTDRCSSGQGESQYQGVPRRQKRDVPSECSSQVSSGLMSLTRLLQIAGLKVSRLDSKLRILQRLGSPLAKQFLCQARLGQPTRLQ
jgi:hypothetical protein